MILVLGGTYDSRKLTERLLRDGHQVIYASVSQYNTDSLPKHPALGIHTGAMDKDAMCAFIAQNKIDVCADATHPYAKEVSLNAIAACREEKCMYLRLERPRIQEDENCIGFDSYEAAVEYLAGQEGRILLTTGSRQLEAYATLPKERQILRVLPTSGVLKKCEALGYKPQNIIAMQGPFSSEMNQAMIRQYNIRFLTTKDSGEVGGVREKIAAAKMLGVKVVFIRRPDISYPKVFHTVEETADYIVYQTGQNQSNKAKKRTS